MPARYPWKEIQFIPGDCNMRVRAIRTVLGAYDLCLAFIDPADIQPAFDTIRTLTRGRRMDLILNRLCADRSLDLLLGLQVLTRGFPLHGLLRYPVGGCSRPCAGR